MSGLRVAAGGSMAAVRSAASLAAKSPASGASVRSAAAEQMPNSGGSPAGGAVAPNRTPTPTSGSHGHVKEAAQAVAHTLKEGDKGGSSSGPKLAEDE